MSVFLSQNMIELPLLTLQNMQLETCCKLKPIDNNATLIQLVKSFAGGLIILTNSRVLTRIDKVVFEVCTLRNIDKFTTTTENVPYSVTLRCFSPHQFKLSGPGLEVSLLIIFMQSLIAPSATALSSSLNVKFKESLFKFSWPKESDRTVSQPYENQEVVDPPSCHLLFDQLVEFKRQNVAIQPPTPQQLSQMVFGSKIHPQLLQFLLSKKPKYEPNMKFQLGDDVAFDVLLESQAFADRSFQQLLLKFRQNRIYDPRTLFETDEQFYTLLAQHPQSLNLQTADPEDLIDENEGDEEDQEIEVESSAVDSQPDPIQKTSGLLSTFVSIFKKDDQKTANKPEQHKKNSEWTDFNFDHQFYCHGIFFQPTYFRTHPSMYPYLQQFVDEIFDLKQRQTSRFRVSFMNCVYQFSPTYPAIIGVPGSIPDAVLQKCMKFRSRGRIAALSWLSPSGVPITRCSQPGKGFGLSRESADERLLKDICDNKQLLVFDARPKLSAFGNRLTGKGFESERAYPFSKTFYCTIENIHVVRESYDAVRKVFMKLREQDLQLLNQYSSVAEDNMFFNQVYKKVQALELRRQVQKSSWIEHVQSILVSAQFIAYSVSVRKLPVMIHCSDGWDRTSQLSALSMLQLDPFYRTLRGFLILIEKEWIAFGHMFATRTHQIGSSKASSLKERELFVVQVGFQQNIQQLTKDVGTTESNGQGVNLLDLKSATKVFSSVPEPPTRRFSSSQTSPVFLQFLDCVYQMIRQKPQYFEFNSRLLTYIAQQILCGGGSFQFDSEHLRTQHQHWAINKSSWDYVIENTSVYINRDFKEISEGPFLHISSCVEDLAIWPGIWLDL